MHANAKVALLLLGLLAGGVAGYVTKPHPVEIVRVGEPPGGHEPIPALPMPMQSSDRSDGGLMAQTGGRILIFAAGGGIIGLLAGFLAGRR